jgi:hypothetical protein
MAAVIAYTYGADSLVSVELVEGGKHGHDTIFTLDAPSEDCELLRLEFEEKNPQPLAIADANQLVKEYVRLIGNLKALKRRGESKWVSPSWARQWRNGKTDDGRKLG